MNRHLGKAHLILLALVAEFLIPPALNLQLPWRRAGGRQNQTVRIPAGWLPRVPTRPRS